MTALPVVGAVTGEPSIRKLPEQAERVETGAVQFGDDWPGVFIRGDSAFAFTGALDWAIAELIRNESPSIANFTVYMLTGLRDTLAECDLTGLSRRPALVMEAEPGIATDAPCEAAKPLVSSQPNEHEKGEQGTPS